MVCINLLFTEPLVVTCVVVGGEGESTCFLGWYYSPSLGW
jgi:hypothetical protein